jgi:hypothetical protein
MGIRCNLTKYSCFNTTLIDSKFTKRTTRIIKYPLLGLLTLSKERKTCSHSKQSGVEIIRHSDHGFTHEITLSITAIIKWIASAWSQVVADGWHFTDTCGRRRKYMRRLQSTSCPLNGSWRLTAISCSNSWPASVDNKVAANNSLYNDFYQFLSLCSDHVMWWQLGHG